MTVSLLQAAAPSGWDPANTSNETPDIDDDSSGVKYSRGTNGIVLVYGPPPYRRERNDTEGLFKTHSATVILKVFARTRAKLDELLAEVERVLNNNRPDPDSYWNWIEDLGETPVRDYANVFDTHVTWEFWAHSIPAAT